MAVEIITNFVSTMWADSPLVLIAMIFILLSAVIGVIAGLVGLAYASSRR